MQCYSRFCVCIFVCICVYVCVFVCVYLCEELSEWQATAQGYQVGSHCLLGTSHLWWYQQVFLLDQLYSRAFPGPALSRIPQSVCCPWCLPQVHSGSLSVSLTPCVYFVERNGEGHPSIHLGSVQGRLSFHLCALRPAPSH